MARQVKIKDISVSVGYNLFNDLDADLMVEKRCSLQLNADEFSIDNIIDKIRINEGLELDKIDTSIVKPIVK